MGNLMMNELLSRLKTLSDKIAGKPEVRWGTVQQTEPLLVRLDGDPEPLPAAVQTVVSPVVDSRVLCLIQRRSIIVIGGKELTVQTSAPTHPSDATNKAYVDSQIGLLSHYRCGSGAQRLAWVNAPYFAVWQDTDGAKGTYWCDGAGVWQQLTGRITFNPGTIPGTSPVFFKGEIFTIPVALGSNETVILADCYTPSRFSCANIYSIAKGTTSTQIRVGLTQFANAGGVSTTVTWKIVPLA